MPDGFTGAAALTFEDVTFAYDRVPVVADVSCSVRRGEVVGLVGPSGAGKSTLLGIAAGLVTPDSGTVTVLGVDRAAPGAARNLAGRVGVVPQLLTLPPSLRVLHAVNAGRLGRWSTGTALRSLIRPVDSGPVERLAARLGIGDLLGARIDELSGGQLQRVAVARALLGAPELVIADEPTSAVDPAWSETVLELLRDVAATGATVVVSLHDVGLARSHCDRIVGMRDGAVRFVASAEELTEADWQALYRQVLDVP